MNMGNESGSTTYTPISMTEEQLQSMLQQVFSLSIGKMKDYTDAMISNLQQVIAALPTGVTEARVTEIVTAGITAASAEHISETRVTEIVNGALADADIPKVWTVTFDPNGGSLTGPSTMKIVDGGLIPKPSDPTKNQMFGGWTYSGSTWNFTTDTVTQNITLTASWHGGMLS